MMANVWIYITFFMVYKGAIGSPVSDETASRILKPRLLNQSSAFPLPQQQISVELSFLVERIDEIDTDSQIVTLSGGARMRWTQKSLSWSVPANSGIEGLYMKPSEIWTPPLNVRNRGSNFKLLSSSPILVSSNGDCDQWIKLTLQLFIPDLSDKNELKISWSLGFSPPYSTQITLNYLKDSPSLLHPSQFDKVSSKWSVFKTEEYTSKDSPDTFFYCMALSKKSRDSGLVSVVVLGLAYFLVYSIELTNCIRYFYAVLCYTAMYFMTYSSFQVAFHLDWQIFWLVSVGCSFVLSLMSLGDPRKRWLSSTMSQTTSMTSRPSADIMIASMRTSSSASNQRSKSPVRFSFTPETGGVVETTPRIDEGSLVSEELGLKPSRSRIQARSWKEIVYIIDKGMRLLHKAVSSTISWYLWFCTVAGHPTNYNEECVQSFGGVECYQPYSPACNRPHWYPPYGNKEMKKGYNGTRDTTRTNRPCVMWQNIDKTKLDTHHLTNTYGTDIDWPGAEDKNYCRTPNADSHYYMSAETVISGPYCYTPIANGSKLEKEPCFYACPIECQDFWINDPPTCNQHCEWYSKLLYKEDGVIHHYESINSQREYSWPRLYCAKSCSVCHPNDTYNGTGMGHPLTEHPQRLKRGHPERPVSQTSTPPHWYTGFGSPTEPGRQTGPNRMVGKTNQTDQPVITTVLYYGLGAFILAAISLVVFGALILLNKMNKSDELRKKGADEEEDEEDED